MSKVVVRRQVKLDPPKIAQEISVCSFAEMRNNILIVRSVGGLGDILMHRMLFEDFKLLMPDCKIHFACPSIYHPAVIDHPFIDKVLESYNIDKNNHLISYNTSTACARYEMMKAPSADLHRSDIWALHCGVKLSRHNMHIRLTDEERKWGEDKVNSIRKPNSPVVAVAPVSAMGNKNLTDQQLGDFLNGLLDRNLTPFGLHKDHMVKFNQMDIPVFCHIGIRQWMSVIAAADYTVSVDTAAFHCAGGMGKPCVGIFTFCNAETYAKYYDKATIVQGPCPAGYKGCYNWSNCPVRNKDFSLPCCSGLQVDRILEAVDKMINEYHCGK